MSQPAKSQITEAHRMRSRSSILKENGLRKDIKKIDTAETITERRVQEGEQRVSRLTKYVVLEGQEAMRSQLEEQMQYVANQHGLIKSCQTQRALIEAQIESLTPTPEQCAARRHHQEQFRQLLNKRLAKDRQADRLLKELREALRERSQLTAQMAEPATALELTIPDDGLDVRRFEGLLDSLPDELLNQSEKWCGHFLGEQKDAKAYVVRAENLLVGETLFDNGLFHFGDLIYLNDEEARDLLCDDYYASTRDSPWRCQSPRVMTVEAYELAAKTAREKGLSIPEAVFWMDAERDAANQKWFTVNGSRKTVHKRADSAEDPTTFEKTVRIRIRYKDQINEVVGEDRALDAVASGSGGPP